MPDGRYTPIHDSWARSRFTQDKPLAASESALLPAYGHAVLGRGAGPNQVQAHLHFGYHAGHAHADELNLLLFAKGKELLSDIGYTHTKLRPWATSTLAHNTVVVDRKNQALTQGWIPASWTYLNRFETEQRSQNSEPVFGNLLLYDAGHDHVQVVEAVAGRSYRVLITDLKEYRRLIALIGVSSTDAYVVDIFRVRGGTHHLSAAHGSADEDQQVATSVQLHPQDGTLLGPATRYSAERDPELDSESFKGATFGLIDKLSVGSTNQSWSATWIFQDNPNLGLKLTMLGGAQRKIACGQAPSIRRAGEDNLRVDQFKMPLLLVEASGENLESTFVALWEPFADHPFISQVRALELEGDSGGAVALAVQIGDRTDYIMSDVDGGQLRKVKGIDLAFRCRFAVISEANGEVQLMHLSDGDLLAKGRRRIRGGGMLQGQILSVHQDGQEQGFEVAADLPPGEILENSLRLVRQTDGRTQAYTIKSVRPRAGRKVIVISGETGLAPAAEGYRYTYFPHTQLKGSIGTFVIPRSLCTSKEKQR